MGPVDPGERSDTLERCAWSLVWLGALVGGLDLWSSWSSWPPVSYLAPLMVLVAVAGLAGCWLVGDPRSPLLQLSALATSLVATLGHEGIGIHVRQYYSTDSGAFNQVAARLLAHGSNPYTSTMASAARLLQMPSAFWTYTAAGGHVTEVSYPAGSFLLEVPAFLLGFHHQVVDWTDLFAWLLTGALIFVLLPSSLRWIGPLLVAVPIYADVFSSGGTDAAFLPFLVLAVWRWDRFGLGRSAGLARWVGPIALGLACSIKQTPWFCVPFVAIGLYLEARASGRRPLRLVARLPGPRGRRLRRGEPALHRVAAVGVGPRHPAALQPPSGGRRTGAGHAGPARGGPRGLTPSAHPGQRARLPGPGGCVRPLVPGHEADLDAPAARSPSSWRRGACSAT